MKIAPILALGCNANRFQAAVQFGSVEICQFLLQTGAFTEEEIGYGLILFGCLCTMPDYESDFICKALDVYRAFLDTGGLVFTPGELSTSEILYFCPSQECFQLALRDSPYCWGDYISPDRLLLAGIALWHARQSAVERMFPMKSALAELLWACGRSKVDTAVATASFPGGQTLLHRALRLLGENFDVYFSTGNLIDCFSEDYRELIEFIKELVHYGADLHKVAGGQTPLQALLHFSRPETSEKLLHTWTQILEDANVDLSSYERMENEIWARTRSRKDLHLMPDYLCYHHELPEAKWLPFKFSCFGGAQASTLLYKLHCRCIIFQLESLPGSWPTPFLPRRICWEPWEDEKEEGEWRAVSEVEIIGKKVFTADEIFAFEELEPFSYLGWGVAQDDAGLMLTLMGKSKRPSRPRSLSQPNMRPERMRRRFPEVTTAYMWSSACKPCVLDGRYCFGCHRARACARGHPDGFELSLRPLRSWCEQHFKYGEYARKRMKVPRRLLGLGSREWGPSPPVPFEYPRPC